MKNKIIIYTSILLSTQSKCMISPKTPETIIPKKPGIISPQISETISQASEISQATTSLSQHISSDSVIFLHNKQKLYKNQIKKLTAEKKVLEGKISEYHQIINKLIIENQEIKKKLTKAVQKSITVSILSIIILLSSITAAACNNRSLRILLKNLITYIKNIFQRR